MKKKDTSVVKTFRLDPDLSEKIDILKKAGNVTMQHIIKEALTEYMKVHLDEAQTIVEKIYKTKELTDLKEHMYIPIDYYALYNDLTKAEVNRMISKNDLQSIIIGDVTLIMIDISEASYKKAELLVIKHNVLQVMKDVNSIKLELSKIKKNIKNVTPKDGTSQQSPLDA